jgi:hypothetical protein
VSGQRRSAAALSEPTATFKVPFAPRPQAVSPIAPPEPARRLPRVTRLLALAYRIDGMIRSREIRNWAEAAKLVGVTRARMTQIGNLLLLAPSIQDELLNLYGVGKTDDPESEHRLRYLLAHPDWGQQEARRGQSSPAR